MTTTVGATAADPASGPPLAADLARTAAFYGAFAAAVGVGGAVGLARRSRRAFVDAALSLGADAGLAIAGVEVRVVEGAEHLRAPRPAIFVFNHTSKFDAFVVMKLLREGYTAVAKAEARSVPMFGPLLRAADVAFVERGNTAQAMDALAPVVGRLRAGTSLVLSPEGTRMPTPQLGPFKKGAFHLAMQAEVPMVPMLFRGAGEIQSRDGQIVRPGVIEVVVLPPLDTSAWRPESVADHRDHVRGLMAAVLDDWPGPASTSASGPGPARALHLIGPEEPS